MSKFSTWLNGLTEDASPDTSNDFVVTYDASAATSKKVRPANLSGSAAGYKRPHDGRLTLSSGVPVTTADVTAATTVYYTPYIGNQIGFADGTLVTFTELSITLATLTAGLPYDVFVYNNSGTATLELLGWTSATARATALAYSAGALVKSGATTREYLGTICITGTTGQCEDSLTKRLVFNYYNRVHRKLFKSDATSHTYFGAYRAWNNSTTHFVSWVQGVAEDAINAMIRSVAYQSNAANAWEVVLNLDSFTVLDANTNYAYQSAKTTDTSNQQVTSFVCDPQLGYHALDMVEGGTTTNSTYAEYKIYASVRG